MKKCLVSVVIPNYNYAHFLRETIDSVLSQTYSDIEIIVVDDGSKDASKNILEGYGEKIRTIFQQNQGVSAARNTGVGISNGEFIAFLDADDSWMPAKIAKQIERFEADTKLGLVHVGVDEVDESGNSLLKRFDGLEGNVSDDLLMLKREGILGGGSGLMIPRKIFDEVGGFDTRLSTSADWDLFYQISKRYSVGFINEILIKYRMHNSNMHANVNAMEHDMMLAFEKAFSVQTLKLTSLRRRAYGSLHQILAGSYFAVGNYRAFFFHSIKSLMFSPGNIRHFIRYGRRQDRRRGAGSE